MKKILIFLLTILLVMCNGCSIKKDMLEPIKPTVVPSINPTSIPLTLSDTDKFISEYNNGNSIKIDIQETDRINYLSSSQALNFIKSGTGIIYFGRPSCPWCRNAISILLSVARKENMEINYLNPGELTGDDIKDFVLLKEYLNEKGYIEKKDGKVTMFIPDVYFLKNGQIFGHHYNTVNSHNDPYIVMSESQKLELFNIYQEFIDKIK